MNHRAIWLAAAVLAVIVLLAQVAGASTNNGFASLATNASVSAQLTGTGPTVALPEQASSVAGEMSANGIAKANEAATNRGRPETAGQNEVVAAAPAAAPVDISGGARPGWGCGDKNHDHSAGPPGRPGATPPPGCSKP
jgi:hypothetical protein